MISENELEVIQVPVNLNGMLTVSVPAGMTAAEAAQKSIERFNARISTGFLLSDISDASVKFTGEAWMDTGMARVGSLEFEVRHDMALNCSGAMVALAPRAGEFGENRLRSRVTAYVSRETVFITALNPINDHEKILVAVHVHEGDTTVSVMDPSTSVEDDSEEQTPTYSVAFPGFTAVVN